MQAKHLRAFEKEGIRFHLTDRGDGTLCLVSIRPCDETDYNWGMYIGGVWRAYRGERFQIELGSGGAPLTPEQAAERLIAPDRAQGLKSRIAKD